MLAVVVPAIKILRHEASSPHNVFILFPILAKSLRKVEGVILMRCPASCMHIDEQNSVRRFIMSRQTAKPFGPIHSVQQEVSHFDEWWHFSQMYAYFENYLLLELKCHSLDIHSASSSCLKDQKLCKTFCYVIPGGRDGAVHLNPSP